jgi:hypothetical protein
MLLLRQDWNLSQWYDFLTEECALRIGEDYQWGWQNGNWAIKFTDPKIELMVRLKARYNDS